MVNSHDLSPAGGAELQLVTLGRQFAKREYRVNFLVDDFNQPSIIKLDEGSVVHKMPLRYMGGPNYYLVPDWVNLFITLWKVGADIHVIKLPNHLLFPVGIYCKLFRKKSIFICQTAWDADRNYLKRNRKFVEYYLYQIGLLFTDHIVAQTDEQREGIKKLYSKGISVIRNVITFDQVEKIQKERFVLWVGSNYSIKRPELFLLIAKKCPHIFFKMIMSTTRQKPDDSDIMNQCLNISNLQYLGSVPFHEIKAFFQTSAILVSTSASEGFSNIFLQAWQCETPVVSLNVDPDCIIKKRDLGRVSLSMEQMILDIEELMNDDELRRRLGANGKKYVEEFHNTATIVDSYCNLFNPLLK